MTTNPVAPWPARFVVYRDPWREIAARKADVLVAHVATPDWLRSKRSLFQCNDPVILCGSGGGDTAVKRTGYVRACDGYGHWGAEFVDAIPPGYRLCGYCKSRLDREFWPYAERDTAEDAAG